MSSLSYGYALGSLDALRSLDDLHPERKEAIAERFSEWADIRLEPVGVAWKIWWREFGRGMLWGDDRQAPPDPVG